jgi:predicted PurR-regulated permease PerM
MENKTTNEVFSWVALWRIVAMMAFVWIFYNALGVVLSIFVAFVIAAGLDAPVTYLSKKGVPRILSTLVLFIMALSFLAGLVYTIVPLAISDFTQLFLNLKDYAGPFLDNFQAGQALEVINQRLNDFSDTLVSGTIPLTAVIGSLFGNIFLAITVLMISFYLTVGRDGIERFLVAVLPTAYEESAIDLYLTTRKKIGQWLKGQMLLSLVIGLLTFIGLYFLDVKYALLLALLAGVFELIPFVGPVFSGGIAVLIALSTSFNLALYVLILFVIIQQLENNLLVPVVMKYTTNLNPAAILISILIGGTVFGFAGLILAVPASVLIQGVIEKWASAKKRKKGLGL